ncbi:MAG: chloride channel protein [Vicinamibacterales bacterium]
MFPDRLRFVLGVGLVAVGAAAFAVAFRESLAWLYRAVYQASDVVDAVAGLPRWLRFAVPVAAAGIAGLIARTRTGPSQGVSNVMEAIALGRVQLSMRTTVSRVSSSWSAIAGGMSIGREGPLIEFGGAFGAAVGQRLGTSLTDTRLLVAAGTAAGFAAAYNTPFAATLFVLETMAGVAAPALLLPTMAATVMAAAVTRSVAGAGPLYGLRSYELTSYLEFLSVAAIAVASAGGAAAFKRVLAITERWFEASAMPQPARAMTGGAVVGLLAMWLPDVAGNGYEPLHRLLDTPLPLAAVVVLVGAKVVATSSSVASGVPGGIFTPMLLIGAAIGTAWAQLVGVAPAAAAAGSYVLIGMAATTAASIHAPLTAAVMIFELSGDYAIVLPLLLATVVATVTSRGLGSRSVYDAELSRRGVGWDLTLEGRTVTRTSGADRA